MNDTLQGWLRQATQMTIDGQMSEATELIQRTLRGLPGGAAMGGHAGGRGGPGHQGRGPDMFTIDMPAEGLRPAVPLAPARGKQPLGRGLPGSFTKGTHTHAGLTRHYKLYVPPGHEGRSLPLVVMLHGCTQDPDDFAAGTGMNERALEQGFCVLYPAQAQDANPNRCWNWFKHNHQQRGRGEPALIASLTLAVIKAQGLDPQRVYVAGLSAGGAMAAIVAAAYPDIYAAAGVHSGLPLGAARSMPEAFAAMQSGQGSPSAPAHGPAVAVVPTIVFHGDQDHTVHPRNGEQVIAAVMRDTRAAPGKQTEQGTTALGRRYTRAIHHGDDGDALAEHWLVHGGGHAWSGGQSSGSYTDPSGPDATGEMLRFFFHHPRGQGH